MKIDNIVRKTLDKISLAVDEAEILFREIMDGKLSDEVLKKVLLSLKLNTPILYKSRFTITKWLFWGLHKRETKS